MKKIVAAAALVAGIATLTPPAFAAPPQVYGSVKLNWSVNTAATLAIVTQYGGGGTATATQGTAAPTLLPELAASTTCNAPASETAFNISFGALNPQIAAATACTYLNAVDVLVTTNDASGWALKQELDAAAPAGVGFCALNNGSGANVTASTRTSAVAAGTFTAGALTACTGTVIPAGAGGADAGKVTPGNPGTVNLEFYNGATNGVAFCNAAGATAGTHCDEDIQLNLAANSASSAAQSAFITMQLIPN